MDVGSIQYSRLEYLNASRFLLGEYDNTASSDKPDILGGLSPHNDNGHVTISIEPKPNQNGTVTVTITATDTDNSQAVKQARVQITALTFYHLKTRFYIQSISINGIIYCETNKILKKSTIIETHTIVTIYIFNIILCSRMRVNRR